MRTGPPYPEGPTPGAGPGKIRAMSTIPDSYRVVVNDEEQYSIWPADRELPLGWRDAGKQGTREECLAHIQEVWTDMRPLSLRKKMEADAAKAKSG
jgi:MbtH protein